ncbi:hypothetical protein K439DRAFT_1548383 [Ramaria rubella]|nr:hypothetical protein K439DRAFT_1548383 [Ramaria rubella]
MARGRWGQQEGGGASESVVGTARGWRGAVRGRWGRHEGGGEGEGSRGGSERGVGRREGGGVSKRVAGLRAAGSGERAAGGVRGWWGCGEGGGAGKEVMGMARAWWRRQEGDGGGKRAAGMARGWWRQQDGGREWREGGRASERVVGTARGWWGRREVVGKEGWHEGMGTVGHAAVDGQAGVRVSRGEGGSGPSACLQRFALQDFAGAGEDVPPAWHLSAVVLGDVISQAARPASQAADSQGLLCPCTHNPLMAPFGRAPPLGCMDVAAHSGAAYAQSKVDGGPVEGPLAWMRSAWGLWVVVIHVGGADIVAVLGGSKNAPA